MGPSVSETSPSYELTHALSPDQHTTSGIFVHQRPAGAMTQFFGGIPRTAMAFGIIYVIGLIVPWFLPETKGQPLPE
ncbi:MAG: hypothetical protein ACJ8AW_23850 [Rhodopila sp.]|jgi:hypothetical protein